MMGKGFIHSSVARMSREDQHAFDRWLKANAVVGLIFAAGLVAMALVGANSAPPGQTATADSMQHRDIPVIASK
jgi:hypothetical protein